MEISQNPLKKQLTIQTSGKQALHILHHERDGLNMGEDMQILPIQMTSMVGLQRPIHLGTVSRSPSQTVGLAGWAPDHDATIRIERKLV